MEYDTTEELANHKRRFCVEGDFGDTAKIDKRMNELKN
jgi:hypothetical protein